MRQRSTTSPRYILMQQDPRHPQNGRADWKRLELDPELVQTLRAEQPASKSWIRRFLGL
jgi:hypothetical protein